MCYVAYEMFVTLPVLMVRNGLIDLIMAFLGLFKLFYGTNKKHMNCFLPTYYTIVGCIFVISEKIMNEEFSISFEF